MHQFIAGRRRAAAARARSSTSPTRRPARPSSRWRSPAPADVDAAVAAARAAFPDWSGAPPVERSAALTRLAAVLGRARRRAGPHRDAGRPASRSGSPPGSTCPAPSTTSPFFAGAARNLEGKAAGEYSGDHTSYVRREAIGVVGSVAPWNYPLQMAAWKILPAIAAGNTIVLKPAELTPLTVADVRRGRRRGRHPRRGRQRRHRHRAGWPARPWWATPTSTWCRSPARPRSGRRVMELRRPAGRKRVHLELGGKAPFVVFDDADLEAAVHGAVAGALINTGQDCTAATRAYVQRPLYDAFVAGVADLMGTVVLGDPLDDRDRPGPAGLPRASRSGSPASSTGPAPTAPRSSAAARCPVARWPAAPTTSPRWSSTPPRTPRSSRTRSSARCSSCCPFDTDDEGLRAGQRHAVRPGRLGLDPRRLPRRCAPPARSGPAASGSTTTSRSSARCRTAATRPRGFGKDMSTYSFEEYTHVKHVMYDGTAAVRKDWHRTIFTGTTPTPAPTSRGDPNPR